MVMHHKNIKYISSEQTMENEQSEIKNVLGLFFVDHDAYFMKQWLPKCLNLVTWEIKNLLED